MYCDKEKLKEILKDLLNPKMTQVKIAKKFKVSRQYVYQVKRQFERRTGLVFPVRHPGPAGLYEEAAFEVVSELCSTVCSTVQQKVTKTDRLYPSAPLHLMRGSSSRKQNKPNLI